LKASRSRSPEELAATDAYEVGNYARLEATLTSCRRAFVYVGELLVA
jgi:hypothetical protein